MTIKNYINLHSKETFEGMEIIVKPFSMFGKDAKSISETMTNLYKIAKEIGALDIELKFYSLSKFAEKVDFSLIPKKIHFGFDSPYSYNPDLAITFFIDDKEFFKISKSCNKM